MRLLLLGLALLFAPASRAVDWTGTITVGSDYVFRGVSQTEGGPALQAGVEAGWKSGLVLSAWASNVDFGEGSDAEAELGLLTGWAGTLGEDEDWSLDAGVAWYLYPGAHPSSDYEYAEVLVNATRKEKLTIGFGISDNALASGGAGAWLSLGRAWTLRRNWSLAVTGGRYLLEEMPKDGYWHASLAATWEKGRLAVEISAHACDEAAREEIGDTADPRLLAAVTWSLP